MSVDVFNTLDISIHALRKESDVRVGHGSHRRLISIHALRKESDLRWTGRIHGNLRISIHALRKESD